MVICVTGKYGVGKSTFSRILSGITGFPIIDVDRIGHEVLELKKEDIVREFGEEILNGDEIDRKKLGKIVFSDVGLLKRLERILHPEMRRIVVDKVKELKNAIVDCALLERMNLIGICDVVVTVVADFETVLRRKGVERKFLERMWKIQEDVRPIGNVIRNEGGVEKLEKAAKRLIGTILSSETFQPLERPDDRHTPKNEQNDIKRRNG